MPAPAVRSAAASDLPEVGRMLHDFNREFDEPAPAPEWLAARVAELVAGGDTIVLVGAVDAGGPSGLALVRIRPNLWDAGQEAYLAELYVRPGQRGLGLGRALVDAAIEVSRARGCDYVCVNVDEPDTAARRLYESSGFRPDGERADAPASYYLERSL
jgi:ribosomal protein S18 acetylase RimI-like enzyme